MGGGMGGMKGGGKPAMGGGMGGMGGGMGGMGGMPGAGMAGMMRPMMGGMMGGMMGAPGKGMGPMGMGGPGKGGMPQPRPMGAMGGMPRPMGGMPGMGQPAPAPSAATSLANAPPGMQKQMLGEKIFPMISRIHPEMAGKITGMMLEMDNSELLMLIESPDQLKAKVDEALRVLEGSR